MKVLIADQFSPAGMEEMKACGIEVHYDAKLNGESLTAKLAEVQPEVLVVRSTKVQVEQIDATSNLQLIMRAGAGYDTIDFNYCSSKGIYVANCPGKNAHAVSELAIGLMLAIDRRTAEGIHMLKEGHWKKSMFANCRGIKGRTLGLIGFGSIGKLVCKAARGLEMNVLVCTRTKIEGLDEQLGFRYVDQDELLARSDIVSIHTPKTPQTTNMVNAEFLGKMKDDAMLINTSRGDLVDEAALLAKLESCPDFWVGADVFVGEPTVGEQQGFNHAIAQHPRVYGTHHCGASTQQAESAIGMEAVRVIKKFHSEGVVDKNNWVNPATIHDS